MYIYIHPKVFFLFFCAKQVFYSYLEANMTYSSKQCVDLSKPSANINGHKKTPIRFMSESDFHIRIECNFFYLYLYL